MWNGYRPGGWVNSLCMIYSYWPGCRVNNAKWLFAIKFCCLLYPKINTRVISPINIPIIFVEGHIMNSPFVAIVPLYALVVRRTVSEVTPVSVRWVYKVEACIITHMSLYMLSHIAAWTQGWPMLPAIRNSGRFLTIPLIAGPFYIWRHASLPV